MQITQNSSRTYLIETSNKILKTPFFFPSISTVRTNYGVYEYFKLIKKVSYPGFLISSYDIYHDEKRDTLIEEVSKTTEYSAFTLMDSGNYEAYWNNDTTWDIKNLESILKDINVDFCFSFDVFWKDGKDINEHVKETITYSAMTAGIQRSGATIPLIHSNPQLFPKIVRKVIEGINPQIIGIPERELGASLLERAKTLQRIRDEIEKAEREIPIHLLGTGNPISILIYTLCGADLYDGLEWCKNVVNPETGHLYHFIQKDLIECDCKACNTDVPYHLQTMSHNLIFYNNFTKEIRQAIEDKQISEILNKYLPARVIYKIKKIAGLK
jgi:queuine/archaeosine tRNA-ribosyltransferase